MKRNEKTKSERKRNGTKTKRERPPRCPGPPPGHSLPLTLCRRQVTQRQSGPGSHLFVLRQDLFSHRFSSPFLIQLRSLKASLLDPLGDPNRPKIGPRRVLKSLFFENVDFIEIIVKPNEKSPKSTPRWDQDRPKIAPRPS